MNGSLTNVELRVLIIAYTVFKTFANERLDGASCLRASKFAHRMKGGAKGGFFLGEN